MQGGHNPYIPFEWYLDLLRYIKRHHPIHIHGFSPSEIDFFAGRFGMTIDEVIRELMAAGLDSIPVAAARFSSRDPRPGGAQEGGCRPLARGHGGRARARAAHVGHDDVRSGRIVRGPDRASVSRARSAAPHARLYGIHLLAAATENSELAHLPKTDAVTYLKTQAIARVVLEDVPNIQASWVTMG